MTASHFFDAAIDLLRQIRTSHGAIPALEAFPRSGSLVGFHPIVETPITLLHHVWGDMGVAQYRFLHRQEGYGRAILEARRLDPDDALILFSHSGINAVILDLALMGKEADAGYAELWRRLSSR